MGNVSSLTSECCFNTLRKQRKSLHFIQLFNPLHRLRYLLAIKEKLLMIKPCLVFLNAQLNELLMHEEQIIDYFLLFILLYKEDGNYCTDVMCDLVWEG